MDIIQNFAPAYLDCTIDHSYLKVEQATLKRFKAILQETSFSLHRCHEVGTLDALLIDS